MVCSLNTHKILKKLTLNGLGSHGLILKEITSNEIISSKRTNLK